MHWPGHVGFENYHVKFMKIMEFVLKWVHMTRYELILIQDEAVWLRIISNLS